MVTDIARIRVAIVGVVVLALFGALLGRLWVLQVATSPERAERIVTANTTKVIQNESVRGRVFDRNGNLLIGNQAEWAVYVDPDIRQDSDRKALIIRRLAQVLRLTPAGLDAAEITRRIDDPQQDPADDLLVAHGPDEVTDEVRLQILEHQEAYPLVKIAMRTTRVYPFVFNGLDGQSIPLAAHVLGYVGNVNADDLANPALEGYESSDTIGRAGIEAAYESQLRGEPQRELVLLDPSRSRIGEPQVITEGRPGRDVYLSIDLNVQAAAEISLRDAILQARQFQNPGVLQDDDPANDDETFKAPGGAVVVLDARTGAVLALASAPSYPVQQFVGGIPASVYKRLQEDPAAPRLNRAAAGGYAIGSTFKPFVALGAMRDGLRSTMSTINDQDGYVEIGEGDNYRRFSNAGGKPSGVVDMRRSLAVSSDVYYYEIGYDYYNIWNDGGRANRRLGDGIQREARAFGFGSKLDIPLGETAGRVPDARWKKQFAQYLYDDPRLRNENDDWNPGDNINLSVGQGDFLASPLQLANAYAALANGGTLLQPELVDRITDADGKVLSRTKPETIRRIPLDPAQRGIVVDGLRDAVNAEDGTAYGVFKDTPTVGFDLAGKTGTAQVTNKGDTSWFAAFYPSAAPQYVVVAMVEEAGFGARVAAPIVRSVLEQLALGRVQTPLVIQPERGAPAER